MQLTKTGSLSDSRGRARRRGTCRAAGPGHGGLEGPPPLFPILRIALESDGPSIDFEVGRPGSLIHMESVELPQFIGREFPVEDESRRDPAAREPGRFFTNDDRRTLLRHDDLSSIERVPRGSASPAAGNDFRPTISHENPASAADI